MTVRELIDALNKLPLDSRVVVYGYEGGYDDPSVSTSALIIDDNWNSVSNKKNHWYFGRHDHYHSHDEENVENPSVPESCVVIGRA